LTCIIQVSNWVFYEGSPISLALVLEHICDLPLVFDAALEFAENNNDLTTSSVYEVRFNKIYDTKTWGDMEPYEIQTFYLKDEKALLDMFNSARYLNLTHIKPHSSNLEGVPGNLTLVHHFSQKTPFTGNYYCGCSCIIF